MRSAAAPAKTFPSVLVIRLLALLALLAAGPVGATGTALKHRAARQRNAPVSQRPVAQRSPAGVAMAGGGRMGTRDIGEAIQIMGQSRGLSMGLLFQKDKDKLSFGTPRTNYKDKISDKSTNF